ncbi:MAG TPA: serine hydrolase domain-containing protein [Pyrinomonadaceae bacterium]|jgi:D-alanyl-D-alanine carboxypeptidase
MLEERLRSILEDYRKKSGFPGAVAAARLQDGSLISVAVGVADRERKTLMKPSARMLGGSTGKMFFAALALQLVAEKRMRLDDPVKKYLGRKSWFARLPNGDDLTVRMLMNHTSGLGGYSQEFMKGLVTEPTRERSPAELIQSVLDSKPLFAAGERFEYTDLNYVLLAMICEEVTGRPAVAEIRERLLKPLGLRNTIPSDRQRLPGLVPGYAGANNPFGGDAMMKDGQLTLNPQFEWAGGGYLTNASDLARWIVAFCEGRAFDRSLLTEVFQGVDAPSLGAGVRYGLGVHIEKTRAGTAYGHGGFFPGYVSWVRWYAEHHLAIALQINTSDDALFARPATDVLDEMAAALTR